MNKTKIDWKVISYCPVDPVFVAEMVDGKLVLILDDPIFE